MPKHSREQKEQTLGQGRLALSLKLETADKNNPNVDVEDFLSTAERWLRALKIFAREQGAHVKWEIVDLKKSSAFIQVQPVGVKTGKPIPTLVKKWDDGLRKIEKTGKQVPKFTPEALAALQDFVISIPRDTIVSVGGGTGPIQISAFTQRRVEEAIRRLPEQPRTEYAAQGSIRGRLAVLDSWNPEERSFRLQLPLNPAKAVRCT
jgi:hypothetical protein